MRKSHKIRHFIVGFLCLVLGLSSSGYPLFGQERTGEENKLDKKFISRLSKDFSIVLQSPRHWGKSDFLCLAAVAGTGLLLFAADREIFDWVQENRTNSSQNASSFIYRWGGGWGQACLLAILYASGELAGKDSLRKTALLSLESWVVATFYDWSMKFAFGRARPSSHESGHRFQPFTFSSRYWSFPSGHALAAFAVATAIADQSADRGVDILAYGLAALVGVATIHHNKHWASDVFIGSAIGYFVAKKICALHRPSRKQTLGFTFECSAHRQAISLAWGF